MQGFVSPGPAVHRTVVMGDIESFGDMRKTDRNRIAIRRGLNQALKQAFHEAGIPLNECSRENGGDSFLILVEPHVPKALFVEALPPAMVRAVCRHNDVHPPEERIRLRMALHAGEVIYDEHGVTSESIIHAARVLDAPPLKAALADSPGVLAIGASARFYQDVVRHSAEVDPSTYRCVEFTVKETTGEVWICCPEASPPP